MYVVSIVILVIIFINYLLSIKLYSVPKKEEFFNNVNQLNFQNEKNIAPNPKYVTVISILTGIMIGIYVALASKFNLNNWLELIVVLSISIYYLVEITRKITIKDDKLILSKAFSKKIELYGNQIKGIYIYSYNKKFLKKRALTTKLVVATKENKLYKFILSSIDNKAVLNMIKENFAFFLTFSFTFIAITNTTFKYELND